MLDPFNIGLISILDKRVLTGRGEIKVSDTFVASSNEFHPEGLYSTEIFSVPGSEERMASVAYMDLNMPIIIPDIYKVLVKARSLYLNIMSGTSFAVFDNTLKDFIPMPVEEGGQTGYGFFISHIDELQPADSGSSSRKRLIRLLKKQRGKLTTRYFLIIPAGYRDWITKEDGRSESDEINPLYLALLRFANSVPEGSTDTGYDNGRMSTQVAAYKIALYIDVILYGKYGAINGKFAKRGVQHGSRNVVTSLIHTITDVDDPSNLGLIDTTMGLLQCIHSYPDLIAFGLRSLLSEVLPGDDQTLKGIDKETLQDVFLEPDAELYELLMSSEGFTTLKNILSSNSNRLMDISTNEAYLGLLYMPPEEYMFVSSVSQLPEGYDRTHLRSVTIMELIYLVIVNIQDRLVGTSTRPPVLGKGGTWGSDTIMIFTDKTEVRYQIDKSGKRTGLIARHYPLLDAAMVDSYSISELNLSPSNCDFDGDKLSSLPVTTTEAVQQIKTVTRKAKFYKNHNGDLVYGLGTVDIANQVIQTITR